MAYSFYGGKPGFSYKIVKHFNSIYEMVTYFYLGGDYNEVNYGEYVIIDTIAEKNQYNNPENGIIYRRGLNYLNEFNPNGRRLNQNHSISKEDLVYFDTQGNIVKPNENFSNIEDSFTSARIYYGDPTYTSFDDNGYITSYQAYQDSGDESQTQNDFIIKFNDERFRSDFNRFVTNPGGGAEYIGQIVGPQGESPALSIINWETFLDQYNNTSTEGQIKGSILGTSTLGFKSYFKPVDSETLTEEEEQYIYTILDQNEQEIPVIYTDQVGQEEVANEYYKIVLPEETVFQGYFHVESGELKKISSRLESFECPYYRNSFTGDFIYPIIIDYIKYGYLNIRDAYGNIQGAYIAMDIPATSFIFHAESLTPYDRYNTEDRSGYAIWHNDDYGDPNHGYWTYINLISQDGVSKQHPYFWQYELKVPKGIHGQDLNQIGINVLGDAGLTSDGNNVNSDESNHNYQFYHNFVNYNRGAIYPQRENQHQYYKNDIVSLTGLADNLYLQALADGISGIYSSEQEINEFILPDEKTLSDLIIDDIIQDKSFNWKVVNRIDQDGTRLTREYIDNAWLRTIHKITDNGSIISYPLRKSEYEYEKGAIVAVDGLKKGYFLIATNSGTSGQALYELNENDEKVYDIHLGILSSGAQLYDGQNEYDSETGELVKSKIIWEVFRSKLNYPLIQQNKEYTQGDIVCLPQTIVAEGEPEPESNYWLLQATTSGRTSDYSFTFNNSNYVGQIIEDGTISWEIIEKYSENPSLITVHYTHGDNDTVQIKVLDDIFYNEKNGRVYARFSGLEQQPWFYMGDWKNIFKVQYVACFEDGGIKIPVNKFKIIYNTLAYDENTGLKIRDDEFDYDGDTKEITHWPTTDDFSRKVEWIGNHKAIQSVQVNSDKYLEIYYQDGTVDTLILLKVIDSIIVENGNDISKNRRVKVNYNNGTSQYPAGETNYINDVVTMNKYGDNVVVLYSDVNFRKNIASNLRVAIPKSNGIPSNYIVDQNYAGDDNNGNLYWYNLGAAYLGNHIYGNFDSLTTLQTTYPYGFGKDNSGNIDTATVNREGWIATVITTVSNETVSSLYAYDYHAATPSWYKLQDLSISNVHPDWIMIISEKDQNNLPVEDDSNLAKLGYWFVKQQR